MEEPSVSSFICEDETRQEYSIVKKVLPNDKKHCRVVALGSKMIAKDDSCTGGSEYNNDNDEDDNDSDEDDDRNAAPSSDNTSSGDSINFEISRYDNVSPSPPQPCKFFTNPFQKKLFNGHHKNSPFINFNKTITNYHLNHIN